VNVVLDLMIHDLDIVSDLAGSAPKEISAAGASVITSEIDTAAARIIFRSGCVADVTASRVSDEKKRLLRVFEGSNVYTSDYQSQQATVSHKKTAPALELVVQNIPTDHCDTLGEEVLNFVRSIQNGSRPRVSGADGRRALALARIITDNITKGINGFVPVP
jgi:predicted dehydrogenase